VHLTVLTWNLKGSKGIDFEAVSGHIRGAGADVVLLQEVQWNQARALARSLHPQSHRWHFKHWPLNTWAEGMAVFGMTSEVPSRARALSFPWKVWSWRRRIIVTAYVTRPSQPLRPLLLLNLHLSPHSAVELRHAEAVSVLRKVTGYPGPVGVAGDLNESPDGPLHGPMEAAGLQDAWQVRPGASEDPYPGYTNWHGWTPGTTRPPNRRIDYVYVSDGAEVTSASVPRPGDEGFEDFARLSDHLPVSAGLEVPDTWPQG
jgi:endonuclease/exonuclease/phosphatase family metal-dependent hydrolase